MAKPIKFSHVLFMTRRFDEMVAWYERLFEAETVHRDPAVAFLTYDTENHRFGFANLDILRPGPQPGAGFSETGVNHLSYTYASAGDVLETYARLRDVGVVPYWSVHHGITLSMYYRDPDGNRIEIQAECFDDEAALAFMRGPVFASNPIGVDYDPDALLARYRSGESEAELLRLPDGIVADIPAAHLDNSIAV
jgi:catechol 2,3-dioxygenase-like lactoylglutathione lyase family enzyme